MSDLVVKDGMNYRSYVASDDYLVGGKITADLLWEQGLRAEHTICDIGAGSLRVGRWLIQNVGPEHYYFIEPNYWLVDEAVNQDGLDLEGTYGATRRDFDIRRAFELTTDYGLISAVLIHVDHVTLRQALVNAKHGCRVLVFDTYPSGPDWTGVGWLYPQIACHADSCVQEAALNLGQLTKLHIDYRGAQWWRLDD